MASYTQYFGMAMFDVGDDLADLNNVQREIERFTIVDKQLYGLYNIFGNGVVSGWTVSIPKTQSTNLSVAISSGMGIIGFQAAQTTYSARVSALPPNATVYIHAQITPSTVTNRAIVFVVSSLRSIPQGILLAAVTTGNTVVASVDNSVRTNISFQEVIAEIVATHKHRGSPTKIDLALETKGQLPGNKIADLDASQITSGKLNPSQIPPIDHNTLLNRGLIDHAGLDLLAKKLNSTTDQLMGDISLINQLRDLLMMKTLSTSVSDPVLAANLQAYDKDWVNTLSFLPGITPDSFLDFSNSTAYISTASKCISGQPVQGGQISTVTWDTKAAFDTSSYRSKVDIVSEGGIVSRADSEIVLVEGFEAPADGSPISSFTAAIQAVDNTSGVYGDASTETQGAFSGQFRTHETLRVTFTKTLSSPQDWSQYTQLYMSVKSISDQHGPIFFYYTNGANYSSSTTEVLAANEITVNSDPNQQNFKQIMIPLTEPRSAVTTLVFFATSVESEYDFWVDNIYLKQTQQYNNLGIVRYQYDAHQEVVFNSLSWRGTLPDQTQIKVRVRTAESPAAISSALFGSYLPRDSQFVRQARVCEIEAQLFASGANFEYAPTLTSLQLSMTINANNSGITIADHDTFARGTFSNTALIGTTPPVYITLKPIGGNASAVGDTSYMSNNIVNEMDSNNIPLLAINGSNLPVSEVQAFTLLTKNTDLGFSAARSAYRTADRRWVICDTNNHRVLVYALDENDLPYLQNAYCGVAVDTDIANNAAIGLTSTYNSNTGVLWIVFSKIMTILPANFALISVTFGAVRFTLATEANSMAGTSPIVARAFGVVLTTDHQSQLRNISEPVSVIVDNGISTDFNEQFAGTPIHMYNAPVTYNEFIYRPVFANFANDGSGRLWICNATLVQQIKDINGTLYYPPTPNHPRNLMLFDPLIDTNIFTNQVYFSVALGGSVVELPNGKIMAAGLDSNHNGRLYSDAFTNPPTILYRSPLNNQPTDVAIANDGLHYWVAESSGTKRAGRVIKVDSLGNVIQNFHGAYTLINSIQVLPNDDLLISV